MSIFLFRAPTLLPLENLPLIVKFHANDVRAPEGHKESCFDTFSTWNDRSFSTVPVVP